MSLLVGGRARHGGNLSACVCARVCLGLWPDTDWVVNQFNGGPALCQLTTIMLKDSPLSFFLFLSLWDWRPWTRPTDSAVQWSDRLNSMDQWGSQNCRNQTLAKTSCLRSIQRQFLNAIAHPWPLPIFFVLGNLLFFALVHKRLFSLPQWKTAGSARCTVPCHAAKGYKHVISPV